MQRTIYVVDDVPTNVMLIETAFKGEQDIVIKKAYNGKEFLDAIESKGPPSLILLDLMMPIMDGFDVLKRLKEVREKNYFPIIVLSALTDKQFIIDALSLGADDYITKPFFVEELKARVFNMLKLKERDEILHKSMNIMESNLRESLQMLTYAQLEIIIRLGKAAEFRDDKTGKHIERIADYVNLVAEELGINSEHAMMMRYAAPMHDVGKIGIPDDILLKPVNLTDEERKIIKMHTVIGSKILSGTNLPLLEFAREIALSHHERWDGDGYPIGLKGTDIPLSGRIVAITDVFDAVTSDRIYKSAWPIEMALNYIKDQRGRQFDPEVVDAFFNVADNILQIKKSNADEPYEKPIIKQIIDGDVSIEELVDLWR
ncbi:MAG: response regulator [Thermodesulfovibrionales bacterium]|nr:response regulator [Thermodesulfovibrionales bacterium]